MKKSLLIITILCCSAFAHAQTNPSTAKTAADNRIVFRDTVYGFAFDSLNHNMGIITKVNQYFFIIKHFKYIGADDHRVFIDRDWTTDPHFICNYPEGPLKKDSIYSFKICFAPAGTGRMNKIMGFYLTTGERITLNITGEFRNDGVIR